MDLLYPKEMLIQINRKMKKMKTMNLHRDHFTVRDSLKGKYFF